MKKVSFLSTPAHLLTYMEYYQFVASQANRIHDLGDSVLTDTELKQLVAVLIALSGDFNKVLLRVQKSLITEDITKKDKVRDFSISALRAAIKNAHFSTDEEVVRCSVALTTLLDTYGNIAREDLDTESATIDKLVEELESATYKPMVDKLLIATNVLRLKTDNDTFKKLYNQRSNEEIAEDAANARELRNKVNEQYMLLCDYVLLKARMKDEEQYNQSVLIINQVRSHYSALKAQSKAAKKEDENTPKK